METKEKTQIDMVWHLLSKAGNEYDNKDCYKLFEKENITGIAKHVYKVMRSEGYILIKEY
jgi:hypothetical protein